MLFRSLLAGLALAVVATDSPARPSRRRAQPTYPLVYPQPSYTPNTLTPGGVIITSPTPSVTSGGVILTGSTPSVTSSAQLVSGYSSTPTITTTASSVVVTDTGLGSSASEGDGLGELNALRAARGLPPYIRDEGLTQAARSCAQFRAANGLFGHTSNDFAFVPAGTQATAAGCAAYPANYGWLSCCMYDNYTYGGAAWVTGRDGKRYMHLFVR